MNAIEELFESDGLIKSRFYKKCPKCKIGLMDTRIRRNPVIKYFFFFLRLKRYECSDCYFTVYMKSNELND
jgi:hypothetical protein